MPLAYQSYVASLAIGWKLEKLPIALRHLTGRLEIFMCILSLGFCYRPAVLNKISMDDFEMS
jgi:hypothetical protein